MRNFKPDLGSIVWVAVTVISFGVWQHSHAAGIFALGFIALAHIAKTRW